MIDEAQLQRLISNAVNEAVAKVVSQIEVAPEKVEQPVEKKRGRGRPRKNPPVVEQPKVVSAKTEEEPSFITTIKKGNNKENGRTPVKAKGNTWVDDGELKDKDDDKIVMNRSKRVRPKATTVDIVCSVCSRKVTIPASLERTDYYRCERCVK